MLRLSDISCEPSATIQDAQLCADRQHIGGLLLQFRQSIDDVNYKTRLKYLIKTGLQELWVNVSG
jgi:hypothetical protein